jgi:phage baseplate assembly protein W
VPPAPFLGIGWGFPVKHDGAELTRAAYEDSIREGITLVLSTAKGERLMRPDFGCGIHELVFAPNDATTRGMAESEVREALLKWEPRIEVLRVAAISDDEEPGRLLVSVDYRVNKTDSRFNLVYPFYLTRPLR